MTSGKPINTHPDFIEISRRAGIASGESRRRKRDRRIHIEQLVNDLIAEGVTMAELGNTRLFRYMVMCQTYCDEEIPGDVAAVIKEHITV